jgi:hypothetical protein
MIAALNDIRAKASQVDRGLGQVFTKVFDWLPELIDRAALEVALEELDPNLDAWSMVEKPGNDKMIKQVLERREALYAGASNMLQVMAAKVKAVTSEELGGVSDA